MLQICMIIFLLAGVHYVDSDSSAEMQTMIDDYQKSIEESKNPDSVEALASDIIKKVFETANQNPMGMSTMELMQKLQALKGEHRYYVLRMLELMDSFTDGYITKAEAVYMLKGPISSSSSLLEFFFKVKDLDGNGIITTWEFMREKVDLEMSNTPLSKLWQKSVEEVQMYDVDDNGYIDLEEFMLGVIFDTSAGIAMLRNKTKMKNKEGATARVAKERGAPKRAHKPNSYRH